MKVEGDDVCSDSQSVDMLSVDAEVGAELQDALLAWKAAYNRHMQPQVV